MAVKLPKMIKYEWLLSLEGGGGMLIAEGFRLRRAPAPLPPAAMPAAA